MAWEVTIFFRGGAVGAGVKVGMGVAVGNETLAASGVGEASPQATRLIHSSKAARLNHPSDFHFIRFLSYKIIFRGLNKLEQKVISSQV
jgi:hypothetical protein